MSKKNNRWLTGGFPADPERIETVLNTLSNLKKDDIASKNRTKYKDFGVEGKNKVQFDNQVIYIGGSAGYNQTYMRVDRDPLVYAVDLDLVNLFYPQDFRDLTVRLIVDEDKTEMVSLSWEDKFVALVKKNNDWLVNGKSAKKEPVDFLLNDIKTLKGRDIFKKGSVGPTLYPLAMVITIKENGQEKKASIHAKDKETYHLFYDGSAFIYELPAAYVASFKKEEKDLTE